MPSAVGRVRTRRAPGCELHPDEGDARDAETEVDTDPAFADDVARLF
jgi:hypothetical protein